MVRLTLLLVLLAGPAAAGCFGPPMPKVVQFDGGRTVQILSHTAEDLTYSSVLPDGTTAVVTTRNGLFVMTSTSHAATYSYSWVTPLPALSDLAPGFHQSFKADMTVEHATRSFFQTDVAVLRSDIVHLGGCDYPVVVVHRVDTQDGKQLEEATLWLSTTLRFALRVEVTADGTRQVHQVVALE